MPDSPDKPESTPEQPAETNAPAPSATQPSDDPIHEPLTDGTVPTVLAVDDDKSKPKPSEKPSRTLGGIYRRADITTTLITFVVALVIAGGGFGAYLFFTSSQNKKAATPKVTTLDQSDLTKLGAYFTGDSSGSSSQVLTFNSSSYFKGQVALGGDLKVIGAAEVDGPTQLSDLTVNKTTTLGVTNVRGQLVVSGPLTLQSPATLTGGATVTGNVTASGNGSFGGSISAGVINAPTINVTGNLNIAGHLVITGSTPTVTPADGAGAGATASIEGTDSAGTVTINTGSIPSSINTSGGLLVNINFKTAYAKVPRVIISADGISSGALEYYVQKTATGFTIGTAINPRSNTGYTYDYWVVQ